MMHDEKHYSADVQRILEERARLLARVPQEEAPGETISVVVVVLDTERYGIEIEAVSEIQPLSGVTPIPGAPPYWAGLVNLRSHLVPLLDLRAFLGLPPFPLSGIEEKGGNPPKGRTSPAQDKRPQLAGGQIVLVNGGGYQIGLLVDNVIEVQKLPRTEIGPSLRKTASTERKITGGLTPDLLTVLDLDKLLTDPRLVVQDEAL